MTLLPLPASASHWNVAITDTGGSNATFKGYSYEWTPPTDDSNTNSFDLSAADSIDGPDDTWDTNSSVTVNATITLTWVADPAGDPAPPSVYVVESAAASAGAGGMGATSTANDGLPGDVYEKDPSEPDQDSGMMATPGNLPGGGHLTSLPVKGGSLTFNRTFSASGSSTYSSIDMFPGTQSAEVSYTISIHAQPYNFRRTYFATEVPPTSVIVTAGELRFQYKWSSTSGVMSELSGETVHENVDAPSNPSVTINGVAYYAPPAPFAWAPDFHKDSVSANASSVDGMYDSYSWGNGQAPITQCFVQKYVANSFNLTQNYKFNDPATMQSGIEQQVPGNSGPFTITDAVVVDNSSPTGYSFTVTKDGSTSLLQPLP